MDRHSGGGCGGTRLRRRSRRSARSAPASSDHDAVITAAADHDSVSSARAGAGDDRDLDRDDGGIAAACASGVDDTGDADRHPNGGLRG